MKKRFIFDENYIKRYAKKDKMKWLIMGGAALVLIIIIIIVMLASRKPSSKPSTPNVVPAFELKEELNLESGSSLPEVVDYFDKLENIDVNDIKITYPDEFEISYDKSACTEEEIEEIDKADEEHIKEFDCVEPTLINPATYGITITMQDKEYTVNLNVVDTEGPTILTENVEIFVGEKYEIDDFIKLCSDFSNECIPNYFKGDLDSDGKEIDYSSFTEPGEYTIKIVAEDLYGNASDPVEVSLRIIKPESKVYTVTFNSNGGSAVEARKVEENTVVAEPESPSRNGYNFLGWYYEGARYDFKAAVTKDITLVANWEKVNTSKPGPNPKPDVPGVINVSSISLDYKTIYLNVNQSKTVKAYVYPTNATNKNVLWSSSDKSIATVTDGKITGVKSGEVTITATSGGKSASVKVVVNDNGSSSTTCQFGDTSYNKNYILSVNLTKNNCAVNPNISYSESMSAKDYQKLVSELSNMGFKINVNYFSHKYSYVNVKNNSGLGLVGYQITSRVTVIDPDSTYKSLSAEYILNPDGSRKFISNNISRNGVSLK